MRRCAASDADRSASIAARIGSVGIEVGSGHRRWEGGPPERPSARVSAAVVSAVACARPPCGCMRVYIVRVILSGPRSSRLVASEALHAAAANIHAAAPPQSIYKALRDQHPARGVLAYLRAARLSAGSRGFAPFARPIGKQPSARSWGRAWGGLTFMEAVLYREALSCRACMNNALYFPFMTPMIP